MNKVRTIFLATAVILSASCGERQTKTANNSNVTPATELSYEEFFDLMLDIYGKLPASAMPDYLQTGEQRRERLQTELDGNEGNHLYILGPSFDSGSYFDWRMAGYPTEDGRNIVLIIQAGGGLDGYSIHSDATFNYHIETGKFTEIKRPVEPLTAEVLAVGKNIQDENIKKEVLKYFQSEQRINYSLVKEGFFVNASLHEFWNKDGDTWEYFDEHFEDCKEEMIYFKWDGKRFVRSEWIF